MGVFVYDTFTDTDATVLSSHTGEVGATWVQHGSFAGVAQTIQSNRVYSATGVSLYYASGVPATPDYEVSVVVRTVSTGSFYISAAGRVDTAANTHYWARITAGELQLLRTVAGSTTTMNSGTFRSPTAGTDNTLTLRMVGSLIQLLWNGVVEYSTTDSNITAAGRAGMRFNNGSTTTGYHADSITASNIGGNLMLMGVG